MNSQSSGAGMSYLSNEMQIQQLAAGGKITVFEKGQSMRTLCLEHGAIREEMRRRKVRFLPAQVTRRIVASLTANPFKQSA